MADENLTLRVDPPRPTRVNPRAVATAAAVLALTTVAAVWYGFRTPRPAAPVVQDPAPRGGTPQLPEALQDLPSTYDQLLARQRRPEVRHPAPAAKPARPRATRLRPAALRPRDDDARRRQAQEAAAAMRAPVKFPADRSAAPSRAAGPATVATVPVDPAASLLGAAMRTLPVPPVETAGLAPAGAGLPAFDPNLQDEKRQFAGQKPPEDHYVGARLTPPRSPYEVKAGTLIPAVLITGINSDLPGQIVGQVREPVYDTVTGGHLLVPQGTRVIGEYDSKIAYGQERVLVVWTRLIFPNGTSISLEGMPGADLRGYAGFADRVNNHWGKLLAGVVLGTVFGASAQVAAGPVQPADPEFGQLAAAGAARDLNQIGQELARKNLAVQPTLEIRPGYRFNVFVTRDLVLAPYPS